MAHKCLLLNFGVMALLQGLRLISAYSTYQTLIPNGNSVPNPCQTDTVWQGVGHLNPAGGGDRNPFGIDFASHGHNWTSVCSLDSDNDGKTNGAELGDPNCVWQSGMLNPEANVTHPGVCEPLSSTNCRNQNSWLTCPEEFNCLAIQNPDVLSITLRLPVTSVPPVETVYMCQAFKLPDDNDYHIIATTPIINSSSLLHHMIVHMCDKFDENDELLTGPKECFMGTFSCASIVGMWAVGTNGQCLADNYGFRMGRTGFKYAVIELHWNNPQLTSGLFDSSGMTLYYTPNLRANDGTVFSAGQTSLEIPPGLTSISVQATCTKYCTSQLKQKHYLVWSVLHMHLIGISGRVELYRNGSLVNVLLNEPSYNYNNPPLIEYNDPIEFYPDDEIKVFCEYQSLNRNTTTKYGEGTSDEMCFAFLSYYPADTSFTWCQQHRTVDVCSNIDLNCDMTTLYKLANDSQNVCSSYPQCPPGCLDLMENVIATGCLSGDIGLMLIEFDPNMKQLGDQAEACGMSLNPILTTVESIDQSTNEINECSYVHLSLISIVNVLIVFFYVDQRF